MRLINPTRAEERIVALYRKEKGYAADIFNTAVDAAQTIILDMYDNEAIEAEPIKHGRWIEEDKVYPELPNDGDYYWYCSECRSQDQHNINVEVPFCWHCGAKMDLDEVKNG